MSDINVTIAEDFTLPSLGKIYSQQFDPNIKLRSMTVAEEMKRLTNTDKPYKAMSEIIEACLETKLPISVYDMCLGDYQYLIHKLRVVTYGPNYNITVICNKCGEYFDTVFDLDTLKAKTYTPDYDKLKTRVLPVSGDTVELRFQTPRDLDGIDAKKVSLKKQFPEISDPTLMLNLESIIKTINGQPYDQISLREYVKKMPLRDSSVILRAGTALNNNIGFDTEIPVTCTECGEETKAIFAFTNEFFRPEADE